MCDNCLIAGALHLPPFFFFTTHLNPACRAIKHSRGRSLALLFCCYTYVLLAGPLYCGYRVRYFVLFCFWLGAGPPLPPCSCTHCFGVCLGDPRHALWWMWGYIKIDYKKKKKIILICTTYLYRNWLWNGIRVVLVLFPSPFPLRGKNSQLLRMQHFDGFSAPPSLAPAPPYSEVLQWRRCDKSHKRDSAPPPKSDAVRLLSKTNPDLDNLRTKGSLIIKNVRFENSSSPTIECSLTTVDPWFNHQLWNSSIPEVQIASRTDSIVDKCKCCRYAPSDCTLVMTLCTYQKQLLCKHPVSPTAFSIGWLMWGGWCHTTKSIERIMYIACLHGHRSFRWSSEEDTRIQAYSF